VGSGQLAAVVDTGPLIHLAEIDCLPLLSIFEELHVLDGRIDAFSAVCLDALHLSRPPPP
jgi:hypothetical protein